jgi:transcriptional regulator with XRE-family HTH domain
VTDGQKIRALREATGETQEVFGERFGVTQNSVSRWERDEQLDTSYRLLIARVAGCSEAEFFHREDMLKIVNEFEDGVKALASQMRMRIEGLGKKWT